MQNLTKQLEGITSAMLIGRGVPSEVANIVIDHIKGLHAELEALHAEFERVKKAAAAIRDGADQVYRQFLIVDGVNVIGVNPEWARCVLAAALSSDAGVNFLSRQQVTPLVEALTDVMAHATTDRDGNYVCWVGEASFVRVEKALVHARALGL